MPNVDVSVPASGSSPARTEKSGWALADYSQVNSMGSRYQSVIVLPGKSQIGDPEEVRAGLEVSKIAALSIQCTSYIVK